MDSQDPRWCEEPAEGNLRFFVRNDMWDVLQDQLGPLSVLLVKFLEEHAGLEILQSKHTGLG